MKGLAVRSLSGYSGYVYKVGEDKYGNKDINKCVILWNESFGLTSLEMVDIDLAKRMVSRE